MERVSRRRFLAGTATIAATWRASRAKAEDVAVHWAALQPGFTMLPVQYILAKKLGQRHGVDLPDPIPYTAVTTYYNDFVAGNYDLCIGSWDTFVARYQAGVPIKYLCSITSADMIALLSPAAGADDVRKLKGMTIAAVQSTGTYRLFRAIIKEAYGFDVETEATIQNVDSPAAAVTLALADRVDAALSWEPNISTGLARRPDLRVIVKAGEVYRDFAKTELPYFGVAVRQEFIDAHPGLADRIGKVFEEALAGINSDPTKAIELFGSNTGVSAEIFKDAMTSRRLAFTYRPMSDPAARQSVIAGSEFLARNGLLKRPVDDKFFIA
jgi:NitT/TauT family transport system substrate-binding protein